MACPVFAVISTKLPPLVVLDNEHHQVVAFQVVHEMINTVGAAVNDVQSSLVLELLVSSPTQQQ